MADVSATDAQESKRAKIVRVARETAREVAGKPYLFGGKTTAGFDCSGYVYYVYHSVFPEFIYLDTEGLRSNVCLKVKADAQPGDLVFFSPGKVPYEVSKGNNRDFPAHVGIVLDALNWISSQTSTGVAQVTFSNPWWGSRDKTFYEYKLVGE